MLAARAPGGRGERVELTQSEQDWLAANPRILLGSDAQWRPYIWRREDGSQAGIETDLIARINALTGANTELVLGDWSDMLERARQGKLHGLATSASHPERADRFLFSLSPYSTHKYIFTRNNSRVARMEDLAGRSVGVLRDNLAELKLLRRWPDINPVEIDTPLALAVGLQNGALDAVIASTNLLWVATQQPPAKAGGLKVRTESPDTGRIDPFRVPLFGNYRLSWAQNDVPGNSGSSLRSPPRR